jgi:hypothetical protein
LCGNSLQILTLRTLLHFSKSCEKHYWQLVVDLFGTMGRDMKKERMSPSYGHTSVPHDFKMLKAGPQKILIVTTFITITYKRYFNVIGNYVYDLPQ